MPSVLICVPSGPRQLKETVLWRHDVDREEARRQDDALALAHNQHFDLIGVDHGLPDAVCLVRSLRTDPATRGHSIAVVMGDDFDAHDLEMLEAGANAILRPPIDAQWDERLSRLMRVPPRRAGRFPVEVKVELMAGVSGVLAGAVL